jgi:DNA-binding CsgD family transcriptional regulator
MQLHADGLLERADELAKLRDAIAAAVAGTGRLLVIEGPAGIGKTALMRQARLEGAAAGMELLVARGLELEREFGFGVARQLVEAPLARLGTERKHEVLQGAAALARPLLGLDRRRGDPPDSGVHPPPDLSFTLVHGLYWLTANLADGGPLMVLLDDAHYADEPSLRYIAYMAARCSELPVLLVLAIRTGDPTTARDLLTSVSSEPGVTVIQPEALSGEAITALVRAQLGERAAPEFCAACARASSGNPFLLGELLTQMEADGLPPGAANAASVEGVSPDSVERSVLARLGRLGDDATALARAVAVLESASLQRATALARLDDQKAARAADALIAAEILAAEPLLFVHPLLRRAVYEQIPPAQRATDHRRAALLLAEAGPGNAAIGAHLLRASPAGEPEVVRLLRTAADDAIIHGDASGAATLLRRALEEPPSANQRAAVLGELGQAEVLSGDPAAADHLTQALALTEQPAERTALACALGDLLVWSRGHSVQAYEMLTRTLAELGTDASPSLRAPIETLRLATASVDVRLVSKVAPQLAAIHELADVSGPAGRGLKIFEASWAAQMGVAGGDWLGRLKEGLDGGRFVADHTGGSPIVVYAAIVLILTDEMVEAEALLADVRADARSRGSILSHLVDLAWGSLMWVRRGELDRAVADAQSALAVARSVDAGWVRIWLSACLADALREKGELEQAAQMVEGIPLERAIGTSAALHALVARARVRLALGDREGGIADLELAGENVIVNNPSFVPWRSTLAIALAPTDPERAQELAQGALARAQELGQARGIGVSLRARARLGGADDALRDLKQAIEVLRASPARLELAHALVDYGAALRRAGQRAAAREPLREAATVARRCGAEPLAQAAHHELLASGAHPRRDALSGPDALTPSERRVAELAAAGFPNREIAQALFVTTKTVGTHLAHIYQKLDLSGQQAREQLTERLAVVAD